jgi:hypothetical protein
MSKYDKRHVIAAALQALAALLQVFDRHGEGWLF